MMRNDIIKLAHGVVPPGWLDDRVRFLIHFAELVAAAEREACAKVCDDIDTEYNGEDVLATWCARAIRARGQQ